MAKINHTTEQFNGKDIKAHANGMLPAKVYDKIYECAKDVNTGHILELGTAHGAATISLAAGLEHTGSNAKVWTVDRLSGGSRERYGDVNENKKIVLNNFEQFGVSNNIDLIIGSPEDAAAMWRPEDKIGLLMLDMDGCIDRDFRLFYNQVEPGSWIIIDDYEDTVYIKPKSDYLRVDQKHRLTFLLTNLFEKKGLLERKIIIGNTYFGKKTDAVFKNSAQDNKDIIAAYNKLKLIKLTPEHMKQIEAGTKKG